MMVVIVLGQCREVDYSLILSVSSTSFLLGAAGALAVVVANLTAEDGPIHYLTPSERLNALSMTMFACGAFQIGMAWFRLAQVVQLIPETGLIGFMNGLAIIIFMAQLPAFQYCDAEPRFVECTLEQRKWLNRRGYYQYQV